MNNNAIDIARRLDKLSQTKEACTAYTLALHQSVGVEPENELECAMYLFEHGDDYKVAYTVFRDLFNRGYFQKELLTIMDGAFYEPNVKLLKNRYEKNCKLLSKYPYLFRRDFVPFEELPLAFFPYDDNGYLPFDGEKFGEYVNFNHEVISRNFFKDLDKPILADDVFSQYELEYLVDNVRKSEWVARENHIYLHYTDWAVFCAYLQVLNLRPLLEEKKIVFLMEEEIAQYPIDFKERFGIDYSKYEVKPIGIREINRVIWHTQLSSHNGGDFFNEIFYGHPNLIMLDSVILDKMENAIKTIRSHVASPSCQGVFEVGVADTITELRWDSYYFKRLSEIKNPSDKDILVSLYLGLERKLKYLDHGSRIAPALFFQPHFYNINYTIEKNSCGEAFLDSKQYDKIVRWPALLGFKYIKTFTPMRRITTSYAASIRFMLDTAMQENAKGHKHLKLMDLATERILNRSYLIDGQQRVYKDSVLVRFEDGKLNPKATFTALAAFLDIPYTESMTYCSGLSGINPESLPGNARGFDPVTVYRTYDDYANEAERQFVEYFMRDAYKAYGYDFHYYKGELVDEAWVKEKISQFSTMDGFLEEDLKAEFEYIQLKAPGMTTEESKQQWQESYVNQQLDTYRRRRMFAAMNLLGDLRFVNKNGQPLRLMPLLKLDPELLEQPLYH